MLSGIHSLLFGKKHHKHHKDDSIEERTNDNDFVVLERRHSDEYDKNSALYPSLDPSHPPPSNLPYAISPSLPNLKDATSDAESPKEESKVEMLHGVPFVLSSQMLLLNGSPERTLSRIMKQIENMKDSEEGMFEDYNYDFELEHSVLSEFSE